MKTTTWYYYWYIQWFFMLLPHPKFSCFFLSIIIIIMITINNAIDETEEENAQSYIYRHWSWTAIVDRRSFISFFLNIHWSLVLHHHWLFNYPPMRQPNKLYSFFIYFLSQYPKMIQNQFVYGISFLLLRIFNINWIN